MPTYPVRFLIVLTSAFAAFMYFYLIILDWTGRLEAETSSNEDLPPSEPSNQSEESGE